MTQYTPARCSLFTPKPLHLDRGCLTNVNATPVRFHNRMIQLPAGSFSGGATCSPKRGGRRRKRRPRGTSKHALLRPRIAPAAPTCIAVQRFRALFPFHRRKNNPRPSHLPYNPCHRPSLKGPCRPAFHGKGGQSAAAWLVGAASPRSVPTLRPTGTTTGLRLVDRLKPDPEALGAPGWRRAGGLGRKLCAGRPTGATKNTLRGTRQAPRSLLVARRLKRSRASGRSGRGNDGACRDRGAVQGQGRRRWAAGA